jgi:hypothetical protein
MAHDVQHTDIVLVALVYQPTAFLHVMTQHVITAGSMQHKPAPAPPHSQHMPLHPPAQHSNTCHTDNASFSTNASVNISSILSTGTAGLSS